MTSKCEKKISIALIDSGIDTTVSDLKNYVKKSTGYLINNEGYIAELPTKDTNGLHGTSIALIIRDLCQNVEFISMNILNRNLSTDSRVMIFAMNEAIEQKVDIIHMSIGTTNWKYRRYLKKLVIEAARMNTIIVASYNNIGFWPTYPACIYGVVGVKSSIEIQNKNTFYFKKGCYYAPDTMIEINGAEDFELDKMKGTSIAAAYVSGHIANLRSKQNISCMNDIKKVLKK